MCGDSWEFPLLIMLKRDVIKNHHVQWCNGDGRVEEWELNIYYNDSTTRRIVHFYNYHHYDLIMCTTGNCYNTSPCAYWRTYTFGRTRMEHGTDCRLQIEEWNQSWRKLWDDYYNYCELGFPERMRVWCNKALHPSVAANFQWKRISPSIYPLKP